MLDLLQMVYKLLCNLYYKLFRLLYKFYNMNLFYLMLGLMLHMLLCILLSIDLNNYILLYMYKYYTLNMQPKNYVELNPEPVQAAPAPSYQPAEPAPQEVVTRDNPGATEMERVMIRWYFESQPQGARIFWRVISSVPDQVKNTNELWLGNTPFEETRSFNIMGLTYQNANDVQIEIKVRRNGYLDQTKRFNVRQALDQQEISSFFDMVKVEE